MYEVISGLDQSSFNVKAKASYVSGLESVPDGMIKINRARKYGFDYRLQISDYSYFQYHRNNGITKLGLVTQTSGGFDDEVSEQGILEDTGNTTYMMRPTEGAMALSDRLNQAYIRTFFNDTYIVSGQ